MLTVFVILGIHSGEHSIRPDASLRPDARGLAGAYETRDNGLGDFPCGVCICGDTTCEAGEAVQPIRSDTGGLQCTSAEWYYCDCRTAPAPYTCGAGQCGKCQRCTDLACEKEAYFRKGCGFGSPGICTPCADCPGGMEKAGGCDGQEDTKCVFSNTTEPTATPTASPTVIPTATPTAPPSASPTVQCDASNYQELTAQARGEYADCMTESASKSEVASSRCVNKFNCDIRAFELCNSNEAKYTKTVLNNDPYTLFGLCDKALL